MTVYKVWDVHGNAVYVATTTDDKRELGGLAATATMSGCFQDDCLDACAVEPALYDTTEVVCVDRCVRTLAQVLASATGSGLLGGVVHYA